MALIYSKSGGGGVRFESQGCFIYGPMRSQVLATTDGRCIYFGDGAGAQAPAACVQQEGGYWRVYGGYAPSGPPLFAIRDGRVYDGYGGDAPEILSSPDADVMALAACAMLSRFDEDLRYAHDGRMSADGYYHTGEPSEDAYRGVSSFGNVGMTGDYGGSALGGDGSPRDRLLRSIRGPRAFPSCSLLDSPDDDEMYAAPVQYEEIAESGWRLEQWEPSPPLSPEMQAAEERRRAAEMAAQIALAEEMDRARKAADWRERWFGATFFLISLILLGIAFAAGSFLFGAGMATAEIAFGIGAVALIVASNWKK